MADAKISALTALVSVATGDLIPVVDISDTTDAASGTTKKITQDNLIPDTSETVKGKVELATDAETVTGSDTARATTPANITAKMAAPGTIGGTTPGAITGTTIQANTGFVPDANDGAYLGQAGTAFADLFLAEGGVINWDSGDATLTQTGDILAVAGADLRVATAGVGTNADSVPTLSSTNTLTNKTLTAPTLGGATSLADGATIKLIVPTVDGTATGPTTAAFVSGYTSSAVGDLVYLDSSGKWQKTDADSTTTSYGLLGIALAVAATDAALLVALPGSIVYATALPTLTIGATYYLGETAGAIQSTIPTGADNVIRVVGFGVHADKLFFLPSSDAQTTVA